MIFLVLRFLYTLLVLFSWYQFTRIIPEDNTVRAIATALFITILPWLFIILFGMLLSNKKSLNPDPYQFEHLNLIVVSQIVQFLSFCVAYYWLFTTGKLELTNEYNIPYILAYQTIVWEVQNAVFYTIHRLCHWSKFMYKHVHSDHHRDNLMPNHYLLASKLSVVETITDVPVQLLVNALLFPSDLFNHCVMMINLIVIIYSGHSGKSIRVCGHATLFQFINHYLFPVDVCIYTRDHFDHHRFYTCNYGFCSTLCDKVFGTYKEFSQSLETISSKERLS